MFVVEPSGRLMGMTEAALVRSPFRSYLVPGIVLFAVVGGTLALAAWAAVRRWKWRGGYLARPSRTSLITRPSGSQHADRRAQI
jgi:hypothetical protein